MSQSATVVHDAATETTGVTITDRMMGWILTIGGLVGGAAAFVLTVEKIALVADPAYVPSCSINPILSCGSIMATDQAKVSGFPNPLIGLVTFPIVVTSGVALLAGIRLPRWWWLGLQAGTLFGVSFVTWLFYQSVYRIGALCPYCMAVWAAMIVVFCYTTLRNLDHGVVRLPRRLTDAALKVHSVLPTVWLLALAALIGVHFWSYWRTLL